MALTRKKRVIIDRLYKAVADYVASEGGNVIVAGGIQIQQPGINNHRYLVAIHCTGNMPRFALPDPPKETP